MKSVMEKLKKEALALSVQDRAKLASILISSLDEESQEEVDNAWDLELQKRVNEILGGKVRGIPAEEVFARIREKHH